MKLPFINLFKKQKKEIIVVSGLPRSGTSMMMKMLNAGGLDLLTDNIRQADIDNPKGYYELEVVKKLSEGNTAWLPEAYGKVIKVISSLLKHLPQDVNYAIIFMKRDLNEVLASQRKMLIHRGEKTDQIDDAEMKRIFESHLANVRAWLDKQKNMQVLYVNYNQTMTDPITAVSDIQAFLGLELNQRKMLAVVDPALYRQKKGADSDTQP